MIILAGKICAFEIFQFSVAPKYGIKNGVVNEYVISDYNNHIESQLDWDVSWLSLLGFNASVAWEMIFLEADCMWGFPKSSGIIYDSDWLNTSDLSERTNYSESSNRIDYYGNLELKLGAKIKTWEFLYILPYVAISYNRIDFTGSDGFYTYKSSSGTLSGDVISYKREMFNYSIGTGVKYNFLTRFTVSLGVSVAIFTQANGLDNHIVKEKDYLDKMQGFFRSFKIGTEFDVKIWQGLSVGAGFNFIYLSRTAGISYNKSSSESKYNRGVDDLYPGYTVSGGTSGYDYTVEAFVRYSF